MAPDVMIQANGLTKRFGSVRALDKVNFEVKRGEVVGFLGPNGAGKSTTMRILTCYIAPSSGAAKVNGHDVFERPLEVRRAIGYLPQRAPLYTDMNVWEYLKFAAEIRGLDESTFNKRLKKVVEVCGLAQSLGKEIGTLSHGYRQPPLHFATSKVFLSRRVRPESCRAQMQAIVCSRCFPARCSTRKLRCSAAFWSRRAEALVQDCVLANAVERGIVPPSCWCLGRLVLTTRASRFIGFAFELGDRKR
jgi:ABC-type transport system involved in cytochrome c biogenesis ATPase subunit